LRQNIEETYVYIDIGVVKQKCQIYVGHVQNCGRRAVQLVKKPIEVG